MTDLRDDHPYKLSEEEVRALKLDDINAMLAKRHGPTSKGGLLPSMLPGSSHNPTPQDYGDATSHVDGGEECRRLPRWHYSSHITHSIGYLNGQSWADGFDVLWFLLGFLLLTFRGWGPLRMYPRAGAHKVNTLDEYDAQRWDLLAMWSMCARTQLGARPSDEAA